MRLIDADSFISNLGNGKGTAMDNIREMVENYPTAYDVDKVVKRLKKVNEDDNICEKFIKNDRKRCRNARGCFDCAISESIAIVKSGGDYGGKGINV